MGKLNNLLSRRLNKNNKSGKVTALAETTATGQRNGFTGIFGQCPLSDEAKTEIRSLLERYQEEDTSIEEDFDSLSRITSEVKAISNQAALLHGERIKRAQTILKNYQDGAFSAWLIATYNNRQTPYNFLQYYEFFQSMPRELYPKIETMPRQAIYALASRDGEADTKQQIVRDFSGQTKEELLGEIRKIFPLAPTDQRRQNVGEGLLSALQKIEQLLIRQGSEINHEQKMQARELLEDIEDLL